MCGLWNGAEIVTPKAIVVCAPMLMERIQFREFSRWGECAPVRYQMRFLGRKELGGRTTGGCGVLNALSLIHDCELPPNHPHFATFLLPNPQNNQRRQHNDKVVECVHSSMPTSSRWTLWEKAPTIFDGVENTQEKIRAKVLWDACGQMANAASHLASNMGKWR